MEDKKRHAPWWVEALTATALGLAVLICIWSMVRQRRASGWGVTLVLLYLIEAAVWSVRAVCAFRQQKSHRKTTEDNNIIDGGETHD